MVTELRFALVATALLIAGCSSSDGIYQVTGSVDLDGVPVEGAHIKFVPEEPTGSSAEALSDVDGQFSAATKLDDGRNEQGMVPGNYLVEIIKFAEPTDLNRRPEHQLPRRYASTNTSGLSVVVQANDENRFELQLRTP